jgi:DNA-binding NarL/FixJ family response regulator
MGKINIILADDHNLVREGFRSIINKNEDFCVVTEAKDGEELMKLLETEKPHIVILDLSMPKLNGIETLKLMNIKFPEIRAIILTMHEEAEYAMKCVQKGAKGYLLKNTEPSELYQAIYTVAEGGTYYTPVISNALLSGLSSSKSQNENLTEREKEVLKHVIKGLSAKMIGDELNISARTVETHKINLMKKLKVSNTAELVTKTLQEKLLD